MAKKKQRENRNSVERRAKPTRTCNIKSAPKRGEKESSEYDLKMRNASYPHTHRLRAKEKRRYLGKKTCLRGCRRPSVEANDRDRRGVRRRGSAVRFVKNRCKKRQEREELLTACAGNRQISGRLLGDRPWNERALRRELHKLLEGGSRVLRRVRREGRGHVPEVLEVLLISVRSRERKNAKLAWRSEGRRSR